MCWICTSIAARAETVLADEDDEQESDRWYSHTPCGKAVCSNLGEVGCGTSAWNWGRRSLPSSLCTTEFASVYVAEPVHADEPAELAENMARSSSIPAAVYGPPQWARSSFTHGAPSLGVYLTTVTCPLLCPGPPPPLSAICGGLNAHGSLRVLYAARIGHCRACPDAVHSVRESSTAIKPRRVSAVLWPLDPSPSPVRNPT